MTIFNSVYKSFEQGGGGWEPWVNTLFYMPLNSTYTNTDQSWNSRNGTTTWTVTFWTNLGVDCGAFLNNGYITIPYDGGMATSSFTISFWCAIASWYNYNNKWIITKWPMDWSHWAFAVANCVSQDDASANFQINLDSWAFEEYVSIFTWNNIWTYITVTYDWSDVVVYKNWIQIDTYSYSYDMSANTNNWVLWAYYSSNYKLNWYLSNVVLEDKVWTAQEISDYFDQTKADYWVS